MVSGHRPPDRLCLRVRGRARSPNKDGLCHPPGFQLDSIHIGVIAEEMARGVQQLEHERRGDLDIRDERPLLDTR
jgi:hypothetical protein